MNGDDTPRLLVVMDPIAEIDPRKDSTFAMLLEAQRRGWHVRYAELGDIWLQDGEARGRFARLRVTDAPQAWYHLGPVAEASLGAFDVILMRKDPPFDLEYVYATYILERAEAAGALVVNRPQSLRDANEKAFTAWFPEQCAPSMISRSLSQLRSFVDHHGRAVIKPLDRMAGKSIFVTGALDPNRNVILETMTDYEARYVMAQAYLPAIVESGDARILLIDGHAVPTALVRMPPPDDHRGNISVGAQTQLRSLTEDERRICAAVGPVLREKGLLFVGIDVIGGLMTEINVTSPTGIRELERDGALQVARTLFAAIESRVGIRRTWAGAPRDPH